MHGRTSRRFWLTGVAATVLATTVLATTVACGGGSSGSGSGSKGPIPLALVYPTSGVWTTQGENSLRGAELAIADINAKGGVLGGTQLVAKTADAGNDPQTAASAVRQVLQQDKVAALLGSYLSSYTLTGSTVAEQSKVPDITQSFSDELVTRGYKYIFKTTSTAAQFSNSVFDYLTGMYQAAGKPIPSVAILASDDASGQQQYTAAVKAAPGKHFDVKLQLQFPANITDTSSLVNRIIAAKPDVVLLNGPDLAEIQIVKALRANGINSPIVGLGGAGVTTQAFVDALGPKVDGVLATVPFNGDASPQATDIASRYIKQYGGTFMPAESGTAYVGVELAAAAINKAKSADPKAVADALRGLSITDFPATLYPGKQIAFNDKGLNEKAYPLMIQYQQGKPVTVWPKQDASAAPKL